VAEGGVVEMAPTAVDNSRTEHVGAGRPSQRGKALREDGQAADDTVSTGGEAGSSSGFLMALLAQLFPTTGGEAAGDDAGTTHGEGVAPSRGAGILSALGGEGDMASSSRQPHGTHNAGEIPAPRSPASAVTDDGNTDSRAWAQGGLVREHGAAAGLSATVGGLVADVNALPTGLMGDGAQLVNPVATAVEAAITTANTAAATGGEAGAVSAIVQAHGAPSASETPASRVGGGEAGRLAVDVNDVTDQIASAASASRARVLVIRLDPPHLGEVRLTLWSSGSSVEGRLEVSQAHTAAALRGETSVVMGRLAEAGVAMRQLEITVREPGQDTGGQERGTDRDGGFRFDGQPSGQPGGGRGQDEIFHEDHQDVGDTERSAVTNPGSSETPGAGVNVWM